MASAFWCIVEDDRAGGPKKVTGEVLGEAARLARQLGGQAEAVWLTDKATDEGLKQLAEWGAARVWLLENPALAPYRGEVWTPALAELATQHGGQAIFGAVTARQRELLARRPVYAGKLRSKVTWSKPPWLATLRPNVFRLEDPKTGATPQVERPAVAIPQGTMTLAERKEEASTGLPELAEADIVVSGGGGREGGGGFAILEELARVVGAAVGASRAAVDAGWRPHRFQIGQTGPTISPKLYLGFGISGALQ